MDRLKRLLHILLAVWFVFLVAEPVPAHDCPMHTPSGYSANTDEGDNGHSIHPEGHFCLCLGCSAGSQSVLVGNVSSLGPIPHFILATKASASVIESCANAPDFILPPSTAPPGLL